MEHKRSMSTSSCSLCRCKPPGGRYTNSRAYLFYYVVSPLHLTLSSCLSGGTERSGRERTYLNTQEVEGVAPHSPPLVSYTSYTSNAPVRPSHLLTAIPQALIVKSKAVSSPFPRSRLHYLSTLRTCICPASKRWGDQLLNDQMITGAFGYLVTLVTLGSLALWFLMLCCWISKLNLGVLGQASHADSDL